MAFSFVACNASSEVLPVYGELGDVVKQVFVVAGGEPFPSLKCPVVNKKRASTPTPLPTAGDSSPAGSSEEEIPLTPEDEKSFLKNALAPPTMDELRHQAPRHDGLRALHAQLREASQTGVAKVGIWGGSHMAAEYFTSEVRRSLNKRYGIGGPGHVNLLYGRAGIRLPVNALCRYGQWKDELPARSSGGRHSLVGAGLFSLSSIETQAGIEVDLNGGHGVAQPQSMTLHYFRHSEGGRFELWMDGQSVGVIDTMGSPGLGVIEVRGRQGLSRMKLQVVDSANVTLLGLFAEKDKGLVVDNFGIAGASSNYWITAQPEILVQIRQQRPYDLVILAYGTNDVTGKDWDPEGYRGKYLRALQAMRVVHPQSHCVLITPGDRVTRFTVRKPLRAKNGKSRSVIQTRYDLLTYPQRHMQASRIQRELGNRFGCATWDMSLEMRKAGGAYKLMKQSPPWMAADLIHLTPVGYQEMAKSFNQWLDSAMDNVN
jgi:lysophospholipase L1-like esterase